MKYGILFVLLAAGLSGIAWLRDGWYILLYWPALSCGVLSLGYLWLGARIFDKSPEGRISPLAQAILLPYLLLSWFLWHLLRCMESEPAFHDLTENIVIGRRLLAAEFPEGIDHIIDLTGEFRRLGTSSTANYLSFPILDATAPSAEQLRGWLDAVAQLKGRLYIHCAQGHGRTGLFATTLLLRLGFFSSHKEALAHVRSKRPKVRLNAAQLAILRETADCWPLGKRHQA